MADTTDPYIAHPDGEQAYQAGLIAARERLAKIEAAMETPGYMPPAAQPTPAPIPTPQPAATPVPAPVPMPKPVQAPVTGFSLNALQNPVAPVSPVAQAFKEAESDPLAPIEETQEVTAPAPTPPPVAPPAPQPASAPVPEPQPEATPVPDIAAMIAAHKQLGGYSALQAPTGFLRHATFDKNRP